MPRLENGFVYLWALFAVVLAGIVMAGTGQMWQTKSQREKEAELMFIGEEFRKAIMSYHNSGTKQYPDSLEDLLKDERSPNIKRHIRKIYLDPLTNSTEWGLVEEPPPNTNTNTNPAANTTKPATATPSTTNATASNSVAGNASATPNNNQTATNTNQTSASGNSTTPGNTTTPSTSSGMSSNIGKRIIGVYSLSEKKPIKKSQFPEHFAKFSEALTYKDWQFVYKPGDAKNPSTSGATAAKPGAASGTNPFAPQSSSTSSTTSSKGASPFASPSDSKAPATGFSSAQ
ncbi:MAG: type II secretion system protein [Nitrosomonas sp.]|nr:type II secretion system protein [Nitrosomonas sp.]MBP6075481.1 type II secretion system protein [Nitrosomonas sp.]